MQLVFEYEINNRYIWQETTKMDSLKKIPCLTILFGNPLRPYEVPAFRGAVISKIPKELTLFHNHLGESFRFSYPLIQYKAISGKAAVVCIGEGTREIGNFFARADFQLRIGEREEAFTVENVWASQWMLQTWNDSMLYSLRRWLPLNKSNYELFHKTEGIVERTKLLESILTGNLLSMSKGLGHYFEKPVSCIITNLEHAQVYTHKNVKMQGFNLLFRSNVYLPDFIGLGKGASMGFGTVKCIKTKTKEDSYDGNE